MIQGAPNAPSLGGRDILAESNAISILLLNHRTKVNSPEDQEKDQVMFFNH